MAEESAFQALVRSHARLMASAIRRVCGRRHRALIPDVEQEVYLALWKRLGSGKEIVHPASYIYRMALLTALAVVRRQGGETLSLDAGAAGDPPASRPGELQPAERAQVIAEVLERLEPDEARALRAYLAGFNHAEVARLYGWSEAVARHRIYRTLERLRAGQGPRRLRPQPAPLGLRRRPHQRARGDTGHRHPHRRRQDLHQPPGAALPVAPGHRGVRELPLS